MTLFNAVCDCLSSFRVCDIYIIKFQVSSAKRYHTEVQLNRHVSLYQGSASQVKYVPESMGVI